MCDWHIYKSLCDRGKEHILSSYKIAGLHVIQQSRACKKACCGEHETHKQCFNGDWVVKGSYVKPESNLPQMAHSERMRAKRWPSSMWLCWSEVCWWLMSKTVNQGPQGFEFFPFVISLLFKESFYSGNIFTTGKFWWYIIAGTAQRFFFLLLYDI